MPRPIPGHAAGRSQAGGCDQEWILHMNSAMGQSELRNFSRYLGERRGGAKIANPRVKSFRRQFGGWRSGSKCLVFCGVWRLERDRWKEQIGAKHWILGSDENSKFSSIRAQRLFHGGWRSGQTIGTESKISILRSRIFSAMNFEGRYIGQ